MIKWSFSGLKDYINCPRQYSEVKLNKRYVKTTSVQMEYGSEVHKALEEYARDNIPLAKNYRRFKPAVDSLLAISGDKYIEHKMALTENKVPCGFDDEDYWVRGIVDFMVVDNDNAFIVDYKTGSNKYPDPKQLKLMALMTFSHFPQVKHIKAALMFLANNSFLPEEYTRDDISFLWSAFTNDLIRLQNSADTNYWPPISTPLCRWCPVKSCEFNGE